MSSVRRNEGGIPYLGTRRIEVGVAGGRARTDKTPPLFYKIDDGEILGSDFF